MSRRAHKYSPKLYEVFCFVMTKGIPWLLKWVTLSWLLLKSLAFISSSDYGPLHELSAGFQFVMKVQNWLSFQFCCHNSRVAIGQAVSHQGEEIPRAVAV